MNLENLMSTMKDQMGMAMLETDKFTSGNNLLELELGNICRI